MEGKEFTADGITLISISLKIFVIILIFLLPLNILSIVTVNKADSMQNIRIKRHAAVISI